MSGLPLFPRSHAQDQKKRDIQNSTAKKTCRVSFGDTPDKHLTRDAFEELELEESIKVRGIRYKNECTMKSKYFQPLLAFDNTMQGTRIGGW